MHVLARKFDDAIAICRKVADENPTLADVHVCLSLAYLGKRMYPQAIEERKAFGQLTGNPYDSEFASALEQGFRSAGWKGALVQGIQVRQAQRKNRYFSAYGIAVLFADMGDRDHAFHWLNVAYREHDYLLLQLKTDFRFDPIRTDPRFAELMQKVGLPQ